MIRKILFVDDDRVLQIVVKKQLASFADQFSVDFANDGLDAIKKMETSCFSLVCIDLNMPRMNGASLFSHIRSTYPHIPVVIMSPGTREEMQKKIPPMGVLEYFSKPLNIEFLGKYLVKHLNKEAKGGIMYNVSPPVFFQFMEMEAKTCTARVLDNGSKDGGILYFRDGELCEARQGRAGGIEAAHKIFSWSEVTVFIENRCGEVDNSINLPLQTIIMQAVSMKDEDEEVLSLGDAAEAGINGGINEKYSRLRSVPLDELTSTLAGAMSDNQGFEIEENVERTHVVDAVQNLAKQIQGGDFYLATLVYASDDAKVLLPRKPPVEITCSSATKADEVLGLLI